MIDLDARLHFGKNPARNLVTEIIDDGRFQELAERRVIKAAIGGVPMTSRWRRLLWYLLFVAFIATGLPVLFYVRWGEVGPFAWGIVVFFAALFSIPVLKDFCPDFVDGCGSGFRFY